MREQVALGSDPRRQLQAQIAVNKKRANETFAAVADLFIEKYSKPKKRTWAEDQRILNTYFKPAWGDIPITEIKRSDVAGVLDDIEARGFYMANRSLAVLRKLFNWAMDERGIVETSPIGRKMTRGKETERKRALSDDEVRAIWRSAETVGGLNGAAVKMLILTGQRNKVVAGMKWSEIKDGVWTIPATESGRSKNKLTQIVPLSSQAIELLKGVPSHTGNDYFFGSGKRGDKPLYIGSKLKGKFDKLCGFNDWVWNDLRGLVATRLKRPLMVDSEIINRVQGRLDQSILGRHYDANDYLADKASALQKWANYLDSILLNCGGTTSEKLEGKTDA
jgi:integrase